MRWAGLFLVLVAAVANGQYEGFEQNWPQPEPLEVATVSMLAAPPLGMDDAIRAIKRLSELEQKVAKQDIEINALQATIESLKRRLDKMDESVQPQPTPAQAQPEPQREAAKGATGEQEAAKPKKVTTITCITSPNPGVCKWCDYIRWDGLEKLYSHPDLKGAYVWTNQAPNGEGSVPRFRICTSDGTCHELRGYFEPEGYTANARNERVQAFHNVIDQIVNPHKYQAKKRDKRWTHQSPDGYKERWTYPGDIRDHLPGIPHLFTKFYEWTEERCEQWHDAHHDVIGPWPPQLLALATGLPCTCTAAIGTMDFPDETPTVP